jgi:hypothetical protein
MRQEENSGILFNATEFARSNKESFITDFKFDLKNSFKDIVRLTSATIFKTPHLTRII